MIDTFQLAAFGPIQAHGLGWALFGKTLLLHERFTGPTPVPLTQLTARHVVRSGDWAKVVAEIETMSAPAEPLSAGWKPVKVFAAALGVSERTLRNRLRAKVFPSTVCVYRRGNQRLLWPDAVTFFNQNQPYLETENGGSSSSKAIQPQNPMQGGLPEPTLEGSRDRQKTRQGAGFSGQEKSGADSSLESSRSAVAVPGRVHLPRRK